jgi:tRNA dimethylallyltransferase
MRALEVMLGTGSSILSFQNKKAIERPFKIVKIGLELDREELYQRINDRVLNMIELGLEKEVKGLEDYAHLNALQTVGYSEWKDYFEQKISREKVIENIQQNTRHYAKRQMTWFKRDPATTWFKAGSIEPKQVLL